MRCSLSGPLAAALLLSVASVPCPAAWLDDTTYNVGVEAILAPRGTIDSGQTVVPRCLVANYGDSAASLSVHMALEGSGGPVYLDSVVLSSLAPTQRETVAFSSWVAEARDSMTAIAWTRCESDTFPLDDTVKVRFLVRVVEGRVDPGFFLPETLDSGVPILPQARVWNYGNQSLWGYLRFRVDSTYYSRSHDIHLIAGGATIVSAGDSWYPLPGWRVMACSLFVLPVDTCIASNLDTLLVRGTIIYDMEMRAVGISPNPAYVGDTVTITAVLAGGGLDTATLWVFAEVTDSLQQRVFYDSQQVHLPGPNPRWRVVFSNPGPYTVACSLYWLPDQNPTNNVKRGELLVYLRPGVEERSKPQAASSKPQPTMLSGASGVKRLASCVIYDALGRRVREPKSGVYFTLTEPSAVNFRKVVLQRK